MRSAGIHAAACGIASVSRADGPPNNSFWPMVAASCARWAAASITSTAAAARARSRSMPSNAPDAARLSSTRLLTARGLIRRAKSARSTNGWSARDALERRERIEDRVALDVELDAGLVHRGRLDLDAEPHRLGTEFGELVGV